MITSVFSPWKRFMESMKLAMEEADRLHEERKRKKQGGKGKKKK